MSEEFETQQVTTAEGQEQTAPSGEKQGRKKSGKSTAADVGATIVSIGIFWLFGLLGGLICYGGYWAVRAVIKSKMSTAAKVILSIVLIVAFLFLMLGLMVAATLLSPES